MAGTPTGKYRLISGGMDDGILYRLSHQLAQYVVQKAYNLPITDGKIRFSPEDTKLSVSLPETLKGTSGFLTLTSLDVSAFETEQYSLFTAYTNASQALSQELCEMLFLCYGTEMRPTELSREQERAVRNAVTIEEKITATKKLDELERSKRRKRNDLADREDEISEKRRKLLADLDSRMIKQTVHTDVFVIEWQII